MSDPHKFKNTNKTPKDAVQLSNVFLHTFISHCSQAVCENNDHPVKTLFITIDDDILKNKKTLKVMDGIDSVITTSNKWDLSEKYDLVIEDPNIGYLRSLGSLRRYWIDEVISEKEKEEIFKSAQTISENGFAIYFLLEPFVQEDLHHTLNEQGFTVCAIIKFPKRSWRECFWDEDLIDRDLLLVIIKRNINPYMIIAEIDYECREPQHLFGIMSSIFENIWLNNLTPAEIQEMQDDYESHGMEIEAHGDVNYDSLCDGIRISKSLFKNFENYRIKEHLSEINSDFLTFKQIKFKKVILEIQIGLFHRQFKEYKNAVYIRLSGKGPATTKLTLTEENPHKYAQVLVDEKQVSPGYICAFLNSEVGELIYNLTYPNTQQKQMAQVLEEDEGLKKTFIEEIEIAIPEIEEQLKISSRFDKLETIQDQSVQLKNNILLNPISSKEEFEKLDHILQAMGALSEQDLIKNLIKVGENTTVEFKQTLSLDIKSEKKEKWIENSIKKTIAGFLNSRGGTLLIGVEDNKNICGINTELKKLFKENEDNFLLHLRNMIDKSIGAENYTFISQSIHEVDGKNICKVTCKKSPKVVFCDTDFYVRTSPATKILVGEEMINYIKNHFGSL
jgi:hypothetical protein